jgi:hypothetical protein
MTGLATFRTNDDSGLWSKRASGEFKHIIICYYTHTDKSTGNQNCNQKQAQKAAQSLSSLPENTIYFTVRSNKIQKLPSCVL